MAHTCLLKLFSLAGVKKHPYFFRARTLYGLDCLNKFKKNFFSCYYLDCTELRTVLLNASVNTGKKLAENRGGKRTGESVQHVITNAIIKRKRMKMEKCKTQARPTKALLFQVMLTLMTE